MPFQSQAQRAKFYAMAERGEISHATVAKWEKETPKGKKLPKKVKPDDDDDAEDQAKKGGGLAGLEAYLEKAGGPFIGPRGGKWQDAAHKIPWQDPSAAGAAGGGAGGGEAAGVKEIQAKVGRALQSVSLTDVRMGPRYFADKVASRLVHNHDLGDEPGVSRDLMLEHVRASVERWLYDHNAGNTREVQALGERVAAEAARYLAVREAPPGPPPPAADPRDLAAAQAKLKAHQDGPMSQLKEPSHPDYNAAASAVAYSKLSKLHQDVRGAARSAGDIVTASNAKRAAAFAQKKAKEHREVAKMGKSEGIEAVGEWLEKAVGHKYIKRTGGPGNYQYTYAEDKPVRSEPGVSWGPKIDTELQQREERSRELADAARAATLQAEGTGSPRAHQAAAEAHQAAAGKTFEDHLKPDSFVGKPTWLTQARVHHSTEHGLHQKQAAYHRQQAKALTTPEAQRSSRHQKVLATMASDERDSLQQKLQRELGQPGKGKSKASRQESESMLRNVHAHRLARLLGTVDPDETQARAHDILHGALDSPAKAAQRILVEEATGSLSNLMSVEPPPASPFNVEYMTGYMNTLKQLAQGKQALAVEPKQKAGADAAHQIVRDYLKSGGREVAAQRAAEAPKAAESTQKILRQMAGWGAIAGKKLSDSQAKLLEGQGLVQRGGSSWVLTDKGHAMAAKTGAAGDKIQPGSKIKIKPNDEVRPDWHGKTGTVSQVTEVGLWTKWDDGSEHYIHPDHAALVKKSLGGIDDWLEKAEKIPGGLAHGKKPEDFDQEQLAAGRKVESEHTPDPQVATEIAMDHLTEDKDYYRKLKTIEKSELGSAVRKFLAANPRPDDSTVHKFAEQLGAEVDDVEEEIYTIAGKKLGKSQEENMMKRANGIQALGNWLSKAKGPNVSLEASIGYHCEAVVGESTEGQDLEGYGKTSGKHDSAPVQGFNANGTPTGLPGVDEDDELDNAARGGASVEGLGKVNGSHDSAPGPGTNKNGPTGLPPVQEGAERVGSGALSPDDWRIVGARKSLVPGSEIETLGRERAILRRKLEARAAQVQAAKSIDEQATDLVKGDGFYVGGSPTLEPRVPEMARQVLCKAAHADGCDGSYSKALTACPHCGAGTVQHRMVPEGLAPGEHTRLRLSAQGGRVRR